MSRCCSFFFLDVVQNQAKPIGVNLGLQGAFPLENFFFFSLFAFGKKREKEEKKLLGTPQTPAGGSCPLPPRLSSRLWAKPGFAPDL
jgi:hypothetical protein